MNERACEKVFTHNFLLSSISRCTIDMKAKCDKHTMNIMNALLTGYHDYNIVQLEVFLLLQRFGQMKYYFASCSNRNKENRRYGVFALLCFAYSKSFDRWCEGYEKREKEWKIHMEDEVHGEANTKIEKWF